MQRTSRPTCERDGDAPAGASTVETYRDGTDVQAAFHDAVAEAGWEHGNGGYTGTIAENTDYPIITCRPVSYNDASRLAGDPLQTDGVGTYRFALEGVEYEIDLSEANLGRLRDALAPFISAGRRLPKHKTGKPAAAGKQSQTGKVRRWWAEHEQTHDLPGWQARGPIPRAVYDAHRQAHTGDH